MSAEKENKKTPFNRKVILGISALATGVVLIAVCSFVPFIIDPTRWMTVEFLTDELIMVAIVIFAMISAMFIGEASNAQDPRSALAKSRSEFGVTVLPIKDNINGFSQWVKKVFQPKDILSMKQRIMRQAGITDYSILELEDSEVKALTKPQKYGDRYYKSITKDQVKVVLDIRHGKYRVKPVEPEYYLSAKNLVDPRTITERSGQEGWKKGLYLFKEVFSRITFTVISAMIFASLMRDLTAEDADIAAAWIKFVSRLWAMVSSAFMGYITGTKVNDIDAEYIEMRVAVHKMFMQDKDFKPLDEQEEAKQQFIDRVKEENVLQIEKKGE